MPVRLLAQRNVEQKLLHSVHFNVFPGVFAREVISLIKMVYVYTVQNVTTLLYVLKMGTNVQMGKSYPGFHHLVSSSLVIIVVGANIMKSASPLESNVSHSPVLLGDVKKILALDGHGLRNQSFFAQAVHHVLMAKFAAVASLVLYL